SGPAAGRTTFPVLSERRTGSTRIDSLDGRNRRLVRDQRFGEFGPVAPCEEVAAREQFDVEAEAFAGDPALEVGREEAIVAAGENTRRDVGPGLQRPRLAHRRAGLLELAAREHLGENAGRRVVEVDRRVVARVLWRDAERSE